jgi:hypothetical protein
MDPGDSRSRTALGKLWKDFSVRESRRFGKGAETGNVLVAYAHPDEMQKPPHE